MIVITMSGQCSTAYIGFSRYTFSIPAVDHMVPIPKVYSRGLGKLTVDLKSIYGIY